MSSVSELVNTLSKELGLDLKRTKEELSLQQKHIYFWLISAFLIFLLIVILLFFFSRLRDKTLRTEIESRFSLLKDQVAQGVKPEGPQIAGTPEVIIQKSSEEKNAKEGMEHGTDEALKIKEEQRSKGKSADGLSQKVNPFEFLNKINVDEMLFLIKGEDLDTRAIIISQLDAEKATVVMEKLPLKDRTDLALKIASLGPIDEVTYKKIAQRLADKYARMPKIKRFIADGKEYLVNLISSMEPFKQREMLMALKTQDPEMYKDIKRTHIFIDELLELPSEVLKEAFSMVDAEVAGILLYSLEKETVNKLFEFFPERRQASLKEELLKLEENPPSIEMIRSAMMKVLDQLNKTARRQGFLPREI